MLDACSEDLQMPSTPTGFTYPSVTMDVLPPSSLMELRSADLRVKLDLLPVRLRLLLLLGLSATDSILSSRWEPSLELETRWVSLSRSTMPRTTFSDTPFLTIGLAVTYRFGNTFPLDPSTPRTLPVLSPPGSSLPRLSNLSRSNSPSRNPR